MRARKISDAYAERVLTELTVEGEGEIRVELRRIGSREKG